jgi:hypothetical protein
MWRYTVMSQALLHQGHHLEPFFQHLRRQMRDNAGPGKRSDDRLRK